MEKNVETFLRRRVVPSFLQSSSLRCLSSGCFCFTASPSTWGFCWLLDSHISVLCFPHYLIYCCEWVRGQLPVSLTGSSSYTSIPRVKSRGQDGCMLMLKTQATLQEWCLRMGLESWPPFLRGTNITIKFSANSL